MKVFKKFLSLIVSAAVIAASLSVPTTALSATTTSKSDSGSFKVGNKTVFYGATTSASYTQASANVSCGMNAHLYAKITAYAMIDNDPQKSKFKEDFIADRSLTVTVDNTFDFYGTKRKGNITSAIGDYLINSTITMTVSVY